MHRNMHIQISEEDDSRGAVILDHTLESPGYRNPMVPCSSLNKISKVEMPTMPSPKEQIREHYAKIDRFNKRNSLGFLKEESMIIQKIFK